MSSRSKEERVVFYSKEDGAAYSNLQQAAKLLREVEIESLSDMNDLIEVYHIKKYVSNSMTHPEWSHEQLTDISKKIDIAQNKVRALICSIDSSSIIDYLNSIDYRYKHSFWELVSEFSAYRNFSNEAILSLLNQNEYEISNILRHRKIVNHFSTALRNFLTGHPKSAELLASSYEQSVIFEREQLFFPESLTLVDRENIVLMYLESDDVNLNYVRLLENSKDSSNLKLSNKTKLKIKKKSKELNNRILEEGFTCEYGVKVALSSKQIEPIACEYNNNTIDISYSKYVWDRIEDDVALFMLFKNTFDFVDRNGLITLVSRPNDLSVLERVMIKSKNEYQTGFKFHTTNQVAHLQILLLQNYLGSKGKRVETLMVSLIDDLNKCFGIDGLRLCLPFEGADSVDKIRVLAPELEFFLKQYMFYVNEGEINWELLELDSRPLRFGDIKSLLTKKYGYKSGSELNALQFYFFSDQSHLFYVHPYENKYTSLFELLMKENVSFDSFQEYQKRDISRLISENHLVITNDYVKIQDVAYIYVLKCLHQDQVLSYWHFPKNVREVIDKMVEQGHIVMESTLFSKEEIKYFNYYLNRKDFTNGRDIRNKYLHGTNSRSEQEHNYEFYLLIKIIVLALLKVIDDLALNEYVKQYGDQSRNQSFQ